MTKRWIFIISFVIFLVGISIVQSVYTNSIISDLNLRLADLQNDLTTTTAISADHVTDIQEIEDYWHEKETLIYLFFNHKDFIEIGNNIDKALSFAKLYDYDNTVQSVNSVYFQLHVVYQALEFNYENIL